MRQLIGSLIVLSLCGVAFSQNSPGNYAEQFAPRLVTPTASPDALPTPSLTLNTPSLATGASSASVNSASVSIITGSSVHFNQPVWYAPGVQLTAPADESSATSTEPTSQSANQSANAGLRRFDWGAATFQSNYGAAQLVAAAPRAKAGRTYANADVARVNDRNGLVRYKGKTEQMN